MICDDNDCELLVNYDIILHICNMLLSKHALKTITSNELQTQRSEKPSAVNGKRKSRIPQGW